MMNLEQMEMAEMLEQQRLAEMMERLEMAEMSMWYVDRRELKAAVLAEESCEECGGVVEHQQSHCEPCADQIHRQMDEALLVKVADVARRPVERVRGIQI